MIQTVQANLNRSRTADDLLYQLACEKDVDLLLISEQYRNREPPSWFSDHLGTAAIWVRNPAKLQVRSHGSRGGFVWIKCKEVSYFSCYLTPNEPIRDFREKIDLLEDAILNTIGNVIVGGDFNARAVEWGMPHPDSRGKYILEMAARTGLVILNDGNTTTFRRPGYSETIPDISLASEALAPRIRDWRVNEEYTGSDHQSITFEIHEEHRQERAPQEQPRRWNLEKIDLQIFSEAISQGIVRDPDQETNGRTEVETLVASTIDRITSACEASMPRRRPRNGKRPAYWWTPEIADMRKRCCRLRRAAQRARNRAEANVKSAEHKAAKKQLRRTINRSKAHCWKILTEDVNTDPWGLGYKIVTQKLGALSATEPMDATTMGNIVGALFPTHPERAEAAFAQLEEFPLFNHEELEKAVMSMKNKKAPGPDGIPSEVLKLVARQRPCLLLDMYNACLKNGIFSHRWKTSRLVLISKGKGDPETPSYYRPLCMLDTAGKVLEKLLKTRLQRAIVAAGDLSPKQYGFRAGRSTVDAIQEVIEAVRRANDHNHHSRRVVLFVTLDVKNAFNSAKWSDMMNSLEHTFNVPKYLLRMIDDYLRDRTLLYSTKTGNKQAAVTAGAAQGSILGPDLWNASYDDLLRMEMPEETVLVGYADDVAALIPARDVEQAQLKLNQVMRRINGWMDEHGLSLALSKTEIVILTRKRIATIIPMRVGEEIIQTKPAAKYLGIMIDTKTSFWEQIRQTADKAAKGASSLSRLMANTNGPKSSKRRLLMNAVQSVLLYGAEVWAETLTKESYRRRLAQVQRRAAIRVASAYRTVSEPAVLIIAGVAPIELLARERKAVYERKAEVGKELATIEAKARTLERWQTLWNDDTRGRWTAGLIREIKPWCERPHGEVDYYLTQFLSGHGYFRQYLYKMEKTDTPNCLYCTETRDDAEHTFFGCDRWAGLRTTLETSVGRLTPDNIVSTMLASEDNWNAVCHWIQSVLRSKKADLDNHAI